MFVRTRSKVSCLCGVRRLRDRVDTLSLWCADKYMDGSALGLVLTIA